MTSQTYVANLWSPILQPAKELPHALQATVEFGDRGGVGDADVFLRAEAFSGNRGDVNLAQEFASDLGGRVYPATPEKCRNIGVSIERAFRQRALHSGYGAQALHHVIAQLDVLCAHVFDALLWTFERHGRRFLHDRGRI